MAGPDLEEVKKIIRSVLIGEKDGISHRDFLSMGSEYQAQEQHPLPFKELGFPTLEAFMRSITDTVYIERRCNGELIYRCIPTRTDKHIHELVQKQRGPGERRAFQARAQKSASRSSSSFSLSHAKPDITELFQRALLYHPIPLLPFPNTALCPPNFFPPALPALVPPLIAPPPIALPFTNNAMPAHFVPPFPASQLASFSFAPAVDVGFAPPLAHQSAAAAFAFASLPPAPFAPTPASDACVRRVDAPNGQIAQSGARPLDGDGAPFPPALGLPPTRVEPDICPGGGAFADRVSLQSLALEPLDALEQRRAIPDDVAPRLPARNVLAAAAAQSSAAAFVRKELPPQPSLPLGMKMPASVCWTESLTSFYVQLAADRDVLRALDHCMNDVYEVQSEQHSPQPPPPPPPLPAHASAVRGTLCAVRFNDSWYRARIDRLEDNGCVTVFYLDYGNYRYGVARAELRVLLEQFCALPALAIHCALPITAITWTPARLFLEPFIEEPLFLIALQPQGEQYVVDVWYDEEPDMSVLHMLVCAKMVEVEPSYLAGLFGDEAPSFVRRLLASGSGSSAGDDAHSPPARAPACAPAREPILRPQASFDQVDHSAMPPQAPSRARGQRQPLALELCGPRIVQQELAAPAPPQEQLQTRALMRSGCFPSPTAARNDSTGTPSGLLQVSITCIASVSEIYAVPLSAHLTHELDALTCALERVLGPAESRESPMTPEQSFAQFNSMTCVRDVRCGRVFVARAVRGTEGQAAGNGTGTSNQCAVFGRWLRVQVVNDAQFESKREVTCALLDYGGRLRVKHCDLFLLPDELAHQSNQLPFLALRCRLWGFENVPPTPQNQTIISQFTLGRQCCLNFVGMETNARDELLFTVRLLRADAIDSTNPRYELDVAVVQKHKLVDLSAMLLDILLGSRTGTCPIREAMRSINGGVCSLLPLPYMPQTPNSQLPARSQPEPTQPAALVRPLLAAPEPSNKPVPINALLRRTNGPLLPLPAPRPAAIQPQRAASVAAVRPLEALTIEEMDSEPAVPKPHLAGRPSPANRRCDANDNHLANLALPDSNPLAEMELATLLANGPLTPAGARTPVPSSPQYATLDDSPEMLAPAPLASAEPVVGALSSCVPAPRAIDAATRTASTANSPSAFGATLTSASATTPATTASTEPRPYVSVHQMAREEREKAERERLQAERTLATSDSLMVAQLQQIVSLPYVRPTSDDPIEVPDDSDSDLVIQRVERVSQRGANRAHVSTRRSAPNPVALARAPIRMNLNLAIATSSRSAKRGPASYPGTPATASNANAASTALAVAAKKSTSESRGRRPPPKKVRASSEHSAAPAILLSDVDEDADADDEDCSLLSSFLLNAAANSATNSSASNSPHDAAANSSAPAITEAASSALIADAPFGSKPSAENERPSNPPYP